jgi:N-acetylneuraminate synthase
MKRKTNRCLIIAEVGQAHDGSLGIAHSFIDAVSKSGADVIKFQTHIAEAETTQHEPWRIKFSTQDGSRYDYWKRMEFSETQWVELKKHSNDVGLQFISSPFSLEAVELLKKVGVHAWKIASGEVNNQEMLDSIAETKQDVYLSTGMSTIEEIDRSVERIKKKGLPLTILQCTSMYPTPPEKVGLNMLVFFRERYGCGVGLSDHSGKIFTGLAAATIGIDVLEVHVTFSKEMFGPDVSSSLTIDELKKLVEGTRYIEAVVENSVDKNSIAEELKPVRNIFTKSIVYRRDLEKGTIIKRDDISFKKPGTGVDPTHLEKVIGKQLKRSVKGDDQLSMSDLI